jgi:ABC-type glycerol-3-phosphate transport system substrate-binding protein
MMFGYASQIDTLSKISGIKLGVAPVPQPSPELVGEAFQEKTVNYAQYQIMTVSRKSAHPDVAWQLVNYLTSQAGQKMINTSTKRLSARLDLIDEQSKQSLYGKFVSQFATAQNWYKKNPTKMNTIFEQAIDAVSLFGQSPQNALESAALSVNKLLGE